MNCHRPKDRHGRELDNQLGLRPPPEFGVFCPLSRIRRHVPGARF
jgi:hypothetical protein